MCFRPVTISNRKLDKNPLIDRLRVQVPCGNCMDCKNQKRMAMWVRLHSEFTDCFKKNGTILYQTLTYNNNSIPTLLGDKDFKCFSKKDVQKFIKRVRSRLERHFPTFDFPKRVHYFVSSEFGGNTHRPHYHILWFVPNSYNYRWVIRKIVDESWQFGFRHYGRNHGFVDSTGALHYCAKYICKDICEEDFFKKFVQKFRQTYTLDKDDEKRLLNRALPFYLLSNGIGLSLLNEISDEDLYKGRVFLPDTHLGVKAYKLPLYIERKYFYDVYYKYRESPTGPFIYSKERPDDFNVREYVCKHDKFEKWRKVTICYKLNSNGVDMKRFRLSQYQDSCAKVYDNVLQLNKNWQFLPEFNEHFKTNFETGSQLSAFISKKLPQQDYISYNLLYRNLGSNEVDYVSNSVVKSSFVEDYNLRLSLEHGDMVLQYDIDKFIDNCNYYNRTPHIMLITDMINYVYYLNRKSHEKELEEKERAASDQKTLFILSRSA